MLDFHIYTPEMYVAENELAFLLARLVSTKCEKIDPVTDGLLHKQPDAVVNACSNRISILTGPPGTGKTTTTKRIVDSFNKAGLRGCVVAPSGKAAKRADTVINEGKNFVNKLQSSTTHSCLEYDGQSQSFNFNRKNKLKYDYIIMDEFPMQELTIMRDFVEAVSHSDSRIVFSGDPYQLPSVGPGSVGRDMISSFVIPSVELDVVLRTGVNSGITYNANRILRGLEISKTDPESGENFKDFMQVPRTIEKAQADIIKWITEDIPSKRGFDPLKDIQLLCPGKNSEIGTKVMNLKLRDVLNNSSGNSKGTLAGFRVGDKVINKRNNKRLNIVNGDVGFVKDIVKGQSGTHAVIDFGGTSGPRNDGLAEMNSEVATEVLRLAYALTVHAFQGSESPVCIMPTFSCHTILMTRNLIYTGLTRAKDLGMLVGDYSVLKKAINNTRPDTRKSRLSQRIRSEFNKLK